MFLRSRNKRILFPLIIVVLIIGVGFFLATSHTTQLLPPYASPSAPTVVPTVPPPTRMMIEGEIVCLPHKDTSGPQTLECAFGIQTDDGRYYAFDTALMSQLPPQYNTGNRIRANGVLTPIEYLSTDHWRKYNVAGIFSATDSLEIIQ